MIGGTELGIVFLIIVVLFGGSKLPKLARSIGQSQKEFQKGLKEGATEDELEGKTNQPVEGKAGKDS